MAIFFSAYAASLIKTGNTSSEKELSESLTLSPFRYSNNGYPFLIGCQSLPSRSPWIYAIGSPEESLGKSILFKCLWTINLSGKQLWDLMDLDISSKQIFRAWNVCLIILPDLLCPSALRAQQKEAVSYQSITGQQTHPNLSYAGKQKVIQNQNTK